MVNNKDDEQQRTITPKIKEKEGLEISYDKEELEAFYPHLMSEISNKKKSVKIDSVSYEVEQSKKLKAQNQNARIPNELGNPGTIDFIRRCSTTEEAFENLDFLLKRKEITSEEYNMYKNQILQEGGLKKLINESGGFKKSGYYLRKYYKKDLSSQRFKNDEN